MARYDGRGGIDGPHDGAQVPPGPVTFTGWATLGRRPAASVVLHVDGGHAMAGPTGRPRPDVADVLRQESLTDAGWEITLDLTDRAPGPVTVTVLAVDAGGGAEVGRVHLEVVAAPPPTSSPPVSGSIDLPVDGTVAVPGQAVVLGWVLIGEDLAARVEVLVDGQPVGLARLGVPRVDVQAFHTGPWSGLCGWEAEVRLSAGAHDVEVVAVALDGARTSLGTRRVEVVAPGPGAPPVAEEELRAPIDLGFAVEGLDLLVVTHSAQLRGSQRWLLELLERSGAGRVFPCTVVAPGPGPLVPRLQSLGITVHSSPSEGTPSWERHQAHSAELTAWARDRGHTAVLVNGMTTHVGVELALALGLPHVWTIHESWTPDAFWTTAFGPAGVDAEVEAAGRAALGQADAVVFAAEATRALYAPLLGPGAGAVIRYGVDVGAISRWCAGTSRDEARALVGVTSPRLVSIVGATLPLTMPAVLCWTFDRIADEFPDAGLAVVGATGADGDLLARSVADCAHADRIAVVPLTHDTRPWYRASDVVVSASDTESMPRVLIEAMAFGVPVLATDIFGTPELVQDGVTGFLCAPRDAIALVEGLRTVLAASPQRMAEVGSAARAVAEGTLDSAGYVRDVLWLLTRLGAGRNAVELLAEGPRPGSGAGLQ